METARSRSGARRARSISIIALLLPAVAAAGDAYYRWVDAQGDVHYGDSPPPEAVAGQLDRPDRQRGDTLSRAHARPSAANESAVGRRDYSLLDTYPTLEMLKRTRARRLEGVNGRIALARYRRDRVRREMVRYRKMLDDLPPDHARRAELQRRYGRARARLDRRRQELAALYRKRARMRQRFAEDIERYRELARVLRAEEATAE